MEEEQCPITRVFQIPELLELILQHLSTKDLLLTQRVSRSFRSTTQGSIRLRRKLFLEPDWNLEGRAFDAYAVSNRPGRKPDNNRLLLRAFPGCYPTITLVILRDGISAGGQTVFSTGGRREEWSWDVCMSFPADHAPDVKPAVSYPEASWRKMLLSQPPCKSLYLVRRWQRGLRPAIIREEGIRMGDFFDEVTKEDPGCGGRKWHESYISSDNCWHFEGPLKCSSVEESDSNAGRTEFDWSYTRTLRKATVTAYMDDLRSVEAVRLAKLLVGRGIVDVLRRRGELW